MSSEQIVNDLVNKFNELKKAKKLHLKYVEKEHYLLIEFGSGKEKCFVFKKYLKPHHDVAKEREQLYTDMIDGVFGRMWDLINRGKY